MLQLVKDSRLQRKFVHDVETNHELRRASQYITYLRMILADLAEKEYTVPSGLQFRK